MCDSTTWQLTVVHHEASDSWDLVLTLEEERGVIDPISDLQGLGRRSPTVARWTGLIDALCREQLRLFDGVEEIR